MYNLSEKAIAEKYEDLLFTKVMALYAAEESEKILSEIENEEPADPKNIEKIYSKTERRENFSNLWKVSKKLITFAAMVVFVAVVSLSSVVVASAEAREAVAEAIYHLVLRKTDRYTEVSIGNSTGFIDPELYDWEGAYAPTYMAPGYKFSKLEKLPSQKISTYYKNDKYVSFLQSSGSVFHVDTEDVDVFKKININESDAIYVEKNGFAPRVIAVEKLGYFITGDNMKQELNRHEILEKITKGEATLEDLDRLEELSNIIKDTALCGLGQSAPNPVLSTLKYFKDEYIAHVERKICPAKVCRALARYEIENEKCVGCGNCARNCPVNAIYKTDIPAKNPKLFLYKINPEECIRCGSCQPKCPVKAIKL